MLDSIDHVNIVVANLDRMVAFYTTALGLRQTKRVTISGQWIDRVVGLTGAQADVVYLDLPAGPRIELLHYRHPPAARPDALGISNTPGLRHLAFRVPDLDAAAQRLRTAGAELLSEPQLVPDTQVTYAAGARKRLLYFHDPEGNLLELCEYR